MARFYAEIQGNRGEASRMGTTASGIVGHIRGWDAGVRVVGQTFGDAGSEEPCDRFAVYMTAGSNGRRGDVLIGYVYEGGQGPYFVARNEAAS